MPGENPGTPPNGGAPWSHDEHLIAFNLYCQLPFGRLHHGNPRIIELAALLGRTPGSVAMKLSNFASLDPYLQNRGIRGLTGIAHGVADVWEAFKRDPEQVAFESERLYAARAGKTVEVASGIPEISLPPAGREREALVRVRVNQQFFRRRVISTYNERCCVTGLPVAELLVASHIVPWSKDAANRLNPRNGLCLNALHDKAFDTGLMWIEDDFVVRFSERVARTPPRENLALSWLISFEGKPLLLPKDFTPDPELLRRHREGISDR